MLITIKLNINFNRLIKGTSTMKVKVLSKCKWKTFEAFLYTYGF